MALEDPQSLVESNPATGMFRVRRDAYKSAEVFAREQELIFSKCWLYIGHESELKEHGDFAQRRIGGRDLIFIRNKAGAMAAFYNSCSHRGAHVCREKSGTARVFTCPYHGWAFNSEGRLLTQLAKVGYAEGLNEDGRLDLQKVPRLESYRGFYFVNFNPNAISLHDYLAGAREVLDRLCDQTGAEQVILPGEHSYTVRANYKFMCENSYDGYHLSYVHASYIDFLKDTAAGTPAAGKIEETMAAFATDGEGRGLGMGHGLLESYVPTGRPVAQWSPSLGEAVRDEIETKRAWLIERYGKERGEYIADTQKNVVIFPNLVINDIMAVTVRMIEPEGPNFMRITGWALGPSDESPTLRAMRLDSFVSFLGPAGFGSPDDIEMLEICQKAIEHTPNEWTEISKGMSSTSDPLLGSGGPNSEVHMQAYWTQWDRVMRGIDSLEIPQ
jgi:p-cumate 2,3-dioxygenase alpha subunit